MKQSISRRAALGFGVALAFALSGLASASENSLPRYIFESSVDGPSNTYYFKAATSPNASSSVGWGSPGCPNATYVYIRDIAIQKDMLAMALTAMTSSRQVTFIGDCDPGGGYLRATRIVMAQ